MTGTSRWFVALPALLAALLPRTVSAATDDFSLQVLVDGRPLCEYRALGTRYVEALKGREYALRLHNPLDVRVAVALSVDGLNTIDARHTTASDARKWVLDPHETITISGWQTSMSQARRFFFTTEELSYAQRLGRSENLGIISAVFYRERPARRVVPIEAGENGADSSRPPAAPQAQNAPAAEGKAQSLRAQSADEYAATGIGDRTDHRVQVVHLDLEQRPAASFDIRYEFHAQLVRLGVIPSGSIPADPLARRQRANGFDGRFCPDIK
jgi:hypothetical protein